MPVLVEYLLIIVITFTITWILVFLTRKSMNLFIQRYAKRLHVDPTNYSFLKNSIGFLFYSIGLFFIFSKIPFLQTFGKALFASAGIMAVIVGFAAQKAFSNIVSGIFILIFKPFRVGDTIELSNNRRGVIEEITLRHIVIRDYENRRIIIPNTVISEETIINSDISDERILKHVEFEISYESNIDRAIEIIQTEAINHPHFIDPRTPEERETIPPVVVRVIRLGNSGVTLKAYIWSNNHRESFILQCDLLKAVKHQFDQSGIEIPYPHRTIVEKKR